MIKIAFPHKINGNNSKLRWASYAPHVIPPRSTLFNGVKIIYVKLHCKCRHTFLLKFRLHARTVVPPQLRMDVNLILVTGFCLERPIVK